MNPTLTSCMLGGALGDSVGLPSEGIGAARISRLRPSPLRQSLVFGRGMVSDDTEHAVMTLLSLQECDGDAEQFARCLARRLRWWLASVPAGIGLATARSIIKLWLCVRPQASGVISAGNGPLMRAPIIGLWFASDPEKLEAFVRASTAITHRDPRAMEAALLIAEATAIAGNETLASDEILNRLERHVVSDEMRLRFAKLREHLAAHKKVGDFADSFSRKKGYVSGFAPDTAAVALYAWLLHRGDFTATIESVIRAGGDTDTVAFVAGSIAGAEAGMDGLNTTWPVQPADFTTKLSTRDLTKEEEFTRAVALGLFDYLRKSRSSGFIVSLSGGADSAAVACLVRLMADLAIAELGPDAAAWKLPSTDIKQLLLTAYQATENSGETTRHAAQALAKAIGATHHELDLTEGQPRPPRPTCRPRIIGKPIPRIHRHRPPQLDPPLLHPLESQPMEARTLRPRLPHRRRKPRPQNLVPLAHPQRRVFTGIAPTITMNLLSSVFCL